MKNKKYEFSSQKWEKKFKKRLGERIPYIQTCITTVDVCPTQNSLSELKKTMADLDIKIENITIKYNELSDQFFLMFDVHKESIENLAKLKMDTKSIMHWIEDFLNPQNSYIDGIDKLLYKKLVKFMTWDPTYPEFLKGTS